MPHGVSRRDALQSVLCTAALGPRAFLPFLRASQRRSCQPPYKRHSAFSPCGQTMLGLYKTAVQRMKARVPEIDPRTGNPKPDPFSWTYQAWLHSSQMEHDSWWFLPWHRAYLWYFEWIVRETIKDQVGSDRFTLPYWPWEDPAFRGVPKEFIDKNNNSLYDDRALSVNDPANPGDPNSPGVALELRPEVLQDLAPCEFLAEQASDGTGPGGFGALAIYQLNSRGEFDLFTLGGGLEKAHNAIHTQVGGAHMGDIVKSPGDPLFWLHHCNVDRLWDLWVRRGGTRANPVTHDWLNWLRSPQAKGQFAPANDPDHPVDVVASDFLPGALNYEYEPYNPAAPFPEPLDSEPCAAAIPVERPVEPGRPPAPSPPPPELPAADPLDPIFNKAQSLPLSPSPCQRLHINSGPLTLQVELTEPGKEILKRIIALARPDFRPAVIVQIAVTGVHAEKPPGVTFRTFLNNPDVTTKTSSQALGYAGTISIISFGHDMHMLRGQEDPRPPVDEFRFDITGAVFPKAGDEQFSLEKILVTIVPVGAGGRDKTDVEVSIAGVELRIARKKPAGRPAAPPPPR